MSDYYWNVLTKIKKNGKRTTGGRIIKKIGEMVSCGVPLRVNPQTRSSLCEPDVGITCGDCLGWNCRSDHLFVSRIPGMTFGDPSMGDLQTISPTHELNAGDYLR